MRSFIKSLSQSFQIFNSNNFLQNEVLTFADLFLVTYVSSEYQIQVPYVSTNHCRFPNRHRLSFYQAPKHFYFTVSQLLSERLPVTVFVTETLILQQKTNPNYSDFPKLPKPDSAKYNTLQNVK